MNKIFGSSLLVSVLLVGCGQIEGQPIGDMVAGAGGSAGSPTAPSSGGEPASVAGSGTLPGAGSGNVNAEQCGAAVCDPNADCFVASGASTDEGICTPLCKPADQTDQTSWNQPCSGAVGGGEGVCRAFVRTYVAWPDFGLVNTPVGVCTTECRPLAQDCPDGFSCDLTDTPQGGPMAHWSFACLPNLKPLETGAACDGSGIGQCSKGATCNFDICQEFCDSTAEDPCPSGGSCIVEEWFPPGTVGVCVD
ncbi:MAG: hypothetical protein WDO74_06885 [Pseudomonadota bacterium]